MKNLPRFQLFIMLPVLIYCMSDCMTYRKAKAKYATVKVDTITVRNTITIPKDSIRYVMHNDTTTYIREVRQGRAKLVIEKTHDITYIKADCDSMTKTVQTLVPQQQVTWGIAPWYKEALAFALGIVIVLLIILLAKKHQ